MKTVLFCLFLFLSNSASIENLVTSLEIRSGKDISKFFSSDTEIIINEKVSKGNKFQLTKTIDEFYDESNVNKFRVIHQGDSKNNLIYMLAEYSSNDDIYKVFLTLLKIENTYTIQKFKIDIKE